MIPYFSLPNLHLFGLVIFTPWLLVAAGIAVGYRVYLLQVARWRSPLPPAQWFFIVTLAAGFLGAHLAKLVLYERATLGDNPWLVFSVFSGLSSFGGFAGAALAGWLYKRANRISDRTIAIYADSALYAMPFGWFFGRAGCATAHEHLGRLSNHFLAVQFPSGARWDLGLLEMFFAGWLALLFWTLNRRPRPLGFFAVWLCVLYGAFRFWLDSLQQQNTGAVSITIDRICAFVILVLAGVALSKARKLASQGDSPCLLTTTGQTRFSPFSSPPSSRVVSAPAPGPRPRLAPDQAPARKFAAVPAPDRP